MNMKEEAETWVLRIFVKGKRAPAYKIEFGDEDQARNLLNNIYGQLNNGKSWIIIDQILLRAADITCLEIEMM